MPQRRSNQTRRRRRGGVVLTRAQRGSIWCTLINGIPYEEKNQDDLNDVMIISEDEVKFWEKIDVNPNLIYDNV